MTVAIGGNSAAVYEGATALGHVSEASEVNAEALGRVATASGTGSIAIGSDGSDGDSLGARATGQENLAVGADTLASGLRTTAFGYGANAGGVQSTAAGAGSKANGTGALAFGAFSDARAQFSTALSYSSFATNDRSTAIGYQAAALNDDATAIGQGAVTTAANQVTLGGPGSSVRIADIASSTAAQVRPVDAVTIDASGTLGRQAIAAASAVDRIRLSMNQIAAVTDAQFSALTGRVSGLEGQVSTLFDLSRTIDKDAQQGIAAVAAMAHPHFPSEAGKTSYASNVATYRGEVGFSAGLMHRLEGDFAISAGVTYAGGDSTTFRAGVAGEF